MSNGESTLVGRTIGSYRVTAEIGRGGMGAVYLAEHPLIGRKVAIKVLLSDVSRDADNVGRFFNEARAAASIRHPALVDVFDFGTLPEGSAYLVMDYLEGDTLAGRLAERKRLPAEMAISVTRQVASGMAVAHAKGIIHRDLKPENIFLMADGGAARPAVKILDFEDRQADGGGERAQPSTDENRDLDGPRRSTCRPSSAGAPAPWTSAPTSIRSGASSTPCSPADHPSCERAWAS